MFLSFRYIPQSLMVNQKIRNCIARYGDLNTLEENLFRLQTELSAALNELVPEFGEIRCSAIFPEQKDFLEQLEKVIQ